MKMTKMKRSMKKIVQCGLVVCALCAMVLLSGCKNAKLEAGERRLVKASLGGGEVRSGRGRRAVASGHASAQPAYYESKFRVKLKTDTITQKCLAVNSEGKLVREECTQGYDASQIWYFDYDGYIFSLSGGKKSCLYQSKVINTEYLPKVLNYEELVASPVACNQSYYKVNQELFKVKLERHEEGELYFMTTKRYDDRGRIIIKDVARAKVEDKAYLGSRHGGKLVFDRDTRYAFSVELEAVEDEEVSPVYKDFKGYYVNFVEGEEKQLPFFTNKKSGKHAYIGKEVMIHDLYKYKVAYYKHALNVHDERRTKSKGRRKGGKPRTFLRESVIALGTKLEDLAAPNVGEHEALIVCVYTAEGKLVGNRCTVSAKHKRGKRKFHKAALKKPEGYYYEGLDASEIAIANEEYKIKDDLYRLYSDGGEQVYINPNKFWHALNVVIPEGVKWELETSYLPKRAFAEHEQRNNVKLLLPLYVDNIGMIGGYITGAQTLYEMKIGSAEEEGALGVVKVVYTDKGTWDGRNYTPPDAETAEFRYEFKGKVVAKRNVPIVKGKLQALPVLAVFVDLEAKKLLAQIGESSWDWGSGPKVHLDKKAGGVVSLSSLSEASVKGLSGGMKFVGSESKHGIQFFMPEVERNAAYGLKDVGLGKSRQRRWAFLAKLFGFGARGAAVRYSAGKAYARLGYLARGALRLSKIARLRRVLSLNRFKILGAGIGGGTAIGFIAAGAGGAFTPSHGKAEEKKQLHPSLPKDSKAVLLRRNAAGSYRSDGKQQVKSKAAWDELCAIGAGNDTSCVNTEVGVSGSYEGKSLNYKVVYTRKRDNTKAERVEEHVSLACFHTNEKLSGQVYNYVCVTDGKPTKVYTTVKPGDKRIKRKIKGNAMYMWVDPKNSLKDVKLHVQSMKKIERKGGVGTDEYLLIAKLPSIILAANEPEMMIIDEKGRYTFVTHDKKTKTLSFSPDSARLRYRTLISVNEQERLQYKEGEEEDDEEVWFDCPPAVPGGGIYRCEASKKGQYMAPGARILRNAATSDGITNEATQLYAQTYDFGPGTAYWAGSGNSDYMETKETPRNYVDVLFTDRAAITSVFYKTTTKKGRTIMIQEPVGVVKVLFDLALVSLIEKTKGLPKPKVLGKTNKFFAFPDEQKFIRTHAANFLDYIRFKVKNLRLVPPEGYDEYLDYIRVGFAQTIDSRIMSLDLYNATTKKMHVVDTEELDRTKAQRSFRQSDNIMRVYPYFDGIYEFFEGIFYPGNLPSFARGAKNSVSLLAGFHDLDNQSIQSDTQMIAGVGIHAISFYEGRRINGWKMNMADAPFVYKTKWMTPIDSNINGSRPYRYKIVVKFSTSLAATASDNGEYNILDMGEKAAKKMDTEEPNLTMDGTYTKLAEIKWNVVQEVGYSTTADIGHTDRAKITDYYYEVKGSLPSNNNYKNWMDNYVKLTQGDTTAYGFRTMHEKNGERVLYYKQSYDDADAQGTFPFSAFVKTDDYIKTHWKEVPVSK